MMTFGEIIKDQRKTFSFTLEYVASKTGSHKGYISGIENGKVHPPAAKMTERLCRVLALDPQYMLLLGWAEKAPKLVRDRAMSIARGMHGCPDQRQKHTA